MKLPSEYTTLRLPEALRHLVHLQMSFKKRIFDDPTLEELRGERKVQQILQDEINKLIYLRNALERFSQRQLVSSGNSSEENSSEFSGEAYQFNSPSSSQEESIAEKKQQLGVKASEAAVAAHDFIQHFNAYLENYQRRLGALLDKCPLTDEEKRLLEKEESIAGVSTQLEILCHYPEIVKEIEAELSLLTAFGKVATDCVSLCRAQLEMMDATKQEQ